SAAAAVILASACECADGHPAISLYHDSARNPSFARDAIGTPSPRQVSSGAGRRLGRAARLTPGREAAVDMRDGRKSHVLRRLGRKGRTPAGGTEEDE